MGLLSYITAHSLDEDYEHVSRRPGRAAEPRPGKPGAAALIIVGLFGLLVATAAVQTSRNAAGSQEGREAVITQIEARSAQLDNLRERTAEMQAEIGALETASLETSARGRALSAQLNRLTIQTGAVAVSGPGVRVVVDDAPDATSAKQEVLDKDLQKLANALWLSGAEAISINGQRLTSLGAIRHAGSAITVNNQSLARPYVVSAIGDPNSMPARFVETTHGAYWLDLQILYGLKFDMTSEESLTLPAASGLTLRHARTPSDQRQARP